MMRLGEKGLALLKSFEKCRLTAYRDSGGVWTIGWGHTGPEVHQGLVWTQEQADAQLVVDTQVAVYGVIKGLDIAVNQSEFDALVCFTFNVGVDAEGHSTLMKLVNAGQRDAAAAEFLKWDHVKGKVVSGLDARRAAEQKLFLLPT